MVTRIELNKLLGKNSNINLSLFLSTGAGDKNTDKGRIELKNLIKEGREQLLAYNVDPNEVDKMLKPITKLIDDTLFWIYQNKGLAIFINDNGFNYFKLPIEFKSEALVSNYFNIKPLFPIFQNNGLFYILALSQNRIKLLQCTKYDIEEIELKDMPTSLEEALKYEDPEKQLQLSTRTSQNTGNRKAAIFHGHGPGSEIEKNEILRYLQEVNAGLWKAIEDKGAPIVIASVDYLLPILKEANKQFNIFSEGISGNPEHTTDAELHEKAWNIVRPYFRQEETNAKAEYNKLVGTGKASNDLKDILYKAIHKGVDKLIVSKDEIVYGKYDINSNELLMEDKKSRESEELINLAVIHTFMNNGQVYVLEKEIMPKNSKFAAIYRF